MDTGRSHKTWKVQVFSFCDSFYNISLVKLVDTRTENIRAGVYETTIIKGKQSFFENL